MCVKFRKKRGDIAKNVNLILVCFSQDFDLCLLYLFAFYLLFFIYSFCHRHRFLFNQYVMCNILYSDPRWVALLRFRIFFTPRRASCSFVSALFFCRVVCFAGNKFCHRLNSLHPDKRPGCFHGIVCTARDEFCVTLTLSAPHLVSNPRSQRCTSLFATNAFVGSICSSRLIVLTPSADAVFVLVSGYDTHTLHFNIFLIFV